MTRPYEQIRPPEGAAPARARIASDAAVLPLDGDWRFRWSPRADDPVPPTDPGAGWDLLPVPAHWQLHGYGAPAYTNQRYPFPIDVPHVPDENPTGEYRVEFDDPAWDGGRALLRFDGVDSWFGVWLNGVHIGDGSGSRLAIEFDVTSALRPGRNLLAVRVHQWSIGSYLEDQDQWWLSGIFRSVALLHRPAGGVDDIQVRADYADGLGTLTVDASAAGARVAIAELGVEVAAGETVVVPVEPWSAESPRLYELTVGTAAETAMLQVGFRTVSTAGGVLTVNGAPVTLRGVNRHDFHPERGRAVDRRTMEDDVVLMKRHNINAVRTAHYPPDPWFLEVCDRHGLYVIDECDIETHGFTFIGWEQNPSDDPRFAEMYLDRMRRTVARDRNHASVIMWSLGNEAGWGRNLRANAEWTRTTDPTRPVHYEQDLECEAVDVYSRMYATFDELDAVGRGEEPRLADADADAHRRGLPMIQCEYAHAMGNGPGGLEDYERIFDRHPRLAGGFVWEWFDHGIAVPTADGGVSYRYGGDFGEPVHDGSYVVDGLLFPDRTPSPGLVELAAVIAPVRMTVAPTGIGIENRTAFTSSDEWSFRWEVQLDGRVIADGVLGVPSVRPGDHVTVPVPTEALAAVADARGSVAIDVVAALAQDRSWAPRGHVVSRGQGLWRDDAPVAAVTGTGRIEQSEDGYRMPLAAFDGRGRPTEILGGEIHSFAVDVWRAPIENDRHRAVDAEAPLEESWRELGLDRLHERVVSVDVDGGDLVVRTRMIPAGTSAGLDVEYRWRGDEEGIDLDVTVRRRGEWRVPLPRLGIRLAIAEQSPGAVPVAWLGAGPGESYPDSRVAARRGLFRGSVRELQTDYVVPQENGTRRDTRTLRLGIGEGWRIDGREPFSFAARPWSERELERAAHADELREDDRLWLWLDTGATGLGSATCGEQPRDEARYVPSVATLSLTFRRDRRS